MSAGTRSRAAEVLKVPVEAAPGAATSVFLAELPKNDFVPPCNSVATLNSIAGLGLPVDAVSTPTLREEVEEFARRYWESVPADRLAVWLTLCTRSPDDPTANRLLTLQAGLELPGTPFPDSKIEQVAAIARELYVLPPRERAIRRNQWLLANAARHNELVATAAAIKKDFSTLAALDPDLFSRLTPQFHVALFAEAATASPLAERPYIPPKPISPPPAKPAPLRPKIKYSPKSARPIPNRDKAVGFIVIMMLFLAGKAFLLLMDPHSSTSQTPYYVPPKNPDNPFNGPRLPKSPPQGSLDKTGPVHYFTEMQVLAFQKYEEDVILGLNPQAPVRYSDWVKQGKPPAFDFRAKSQP
jgi:hypothetical protein